MRREFLAEFMRPPGEMSNTGLVGGLAVGPVGGPAVTDEDPGIVLFEEQLASSNPRPGVILYSVAFGHVTTHSHARPPPTRHPVSSTVTAAAVFTTHSIAAYVGASAVAVTSAARHQRRP